ncbi:hypothetical protein E2C01_069721 [Portunus trituberculatus]|uniref:Uncharacterized protein n=1 Tax=Portunus trituberculatus TaxID=210409 RepID=A0A5B7HZN8_PORTR|nr:hypothetical protein [Portunus trituberculatus]
MGRGDLGRAGGRVQVKQQVSERCTCCSVLYCGGRLEGGRKERCQRSKWIGENTVLGMGRVGTRVARNRYRRKAAGETCVNVVVEDAGHGSWLVTPALPIKKSHKSARRPRREEGGKLRRTWEKFQGGGKERGSEGVVWCGAVLWVGNLQHLA